MARTLEKAKGRQSGRKSFAGIPRHVMESRDFRTLPANAVRVLLWLAYQYRGQNNGDLSATFTQAKTWGIGGRDALAKALAELQARRLIVRTRQGVFTNPGGRCALYGLAWRPIDECPGKGLEVPSTIGPVRLEWD